MSKIKTWRFSDFKRQMESTDIDDLINALNKFIEYLQTNSNFQDIENNEQVYNIVIDCLDTPQYTMISDPIKKHHCLQVLLLLSTRISISILKKFIDKILTRALANKDDALLSDYSLLMVDIFSALVNSDHERQETYIKYAAHRCLEQVFTNNSAPLMILSSLIENLGTLLTNQQFTNLYDKMVSLLENESKEQSYNLSFSKDLSSLARFWAVYASPDLLQKFIKVLIDRIQKGSTLAFNIFTTLVISTPLSFSSHIDFLIELYYNKIGLLLQDNMDASEEEVKDAELSIQSLNSIIGAFSKRFVSSASFYCELSFDLFTYGVDAPVFQSSSQIQEVSDSEFDAGEDDNFMDDDEIAGEDDEFINEDGELSDEEQFNDQSYTIRKAINVFAQTLIKYFPDVFMKTFLQNEDRQTSTLNFIVDPDSSSKAVSLKTLILFAKSNKAKIPEKVVKNWINAFINEVSKPTQKDLAIVYPAFSEFLNEFPSLISLYSLKIVERITKTQNFYQKTQNKQQQIIIQTMLDLLNTLISGTSKVDEIASPICEILIPLTSENTQPVLQPLLYTSTLLFSKATTYSIDSITKLNKKIIAIAKTDNPLATYTIDPLSVYVSIYSSKDKSCASESLSTIIKLEPRSLSFTLNALSAIALIASSPSRNVISSVSKDVFSIIKTRISSSLNEPTILYRSLWALYSCLQSKNLFGNKECDSLVPSIVNCITFNDNKIKNLVINILKKLSSPDTVSSSLIPQLKKLFTSNDVLTVQIIEGITEILAPVKDEKLADMVNSLITEGKNLADKSGFEKNVSYIALFVGSIVSSRKTLREKVLSEFSKEISKKEVTTINAFSLRCIGEIGIRFSLAENKLIVDRIFELVLCDNRLIFSSAVHSAGLVAANDTAIQKILPQIIERMKKDNDRLSTWLGVVAKCLKRRQRIKTTIKFNFAELFNYLVSIADFTKETQATFADCLNSILVLEPSLLPSYFEKMALKDNACPIIVRSISDYIENSLEKAEDVEPILTKVVPYLDPNTPSISNGVILCLKYSIKYAALHKYLVSSFPTICKCAEVNDKQYATVYYGTTSQKVDLGRPMRINALDTISTLFSLIPEKLNIDQMIISCTKTLDDPLQEVQTRDLTFIVQSCNNSITLQPIIKHVVPKISNITLDQEALHDTYNLYVNLIAKLKVLTNHSKVLAIEKIAASIEDKSLLKKYEDDFNQEILHLNQESTKYNNFNSKTVCYQLMLQFNKNAAEIYV